jgi:amidophosphoribosyltransferase
MAAGHSIEEMRTLIECDSLGFLSEDGLRRAAEQSEGWCMACFTGDYPVYLPRGLTKNVIAEDESVSNAASGSGATPRIVMEDPYAGKNL